VAAFMGAENVLQLEGAPQGGNFNIAASRSNAAGSVPLLGRSLSAGSVEARFRPEAAQLFSTDTPVAAPGISFLGDVTAVSYPGGHWRHSVRIGEREIMADAARAFEPGDRVQVHVAPEALFLFNSPESNPATSISRTAAGKAHA
jgi:hypothetical protein